MDTTDAKILDVIQRGLPLVAQPYAAVGEEVGLSEHEVISRVLRLRQEGVIRQISAIFDSHSLGYTSALVAFAVCEDRLESVAASVAALDSVSHCYSRDHRFNLWFTITVEAGCIVSDAVGPLAGMEGVLDHLLLPAIRVFKVGVFLKMADGEPAFKFPSQSGKGRSLDLTPTDRAAVQILQKDLPAVPRPFDLLAEEVGLAVETVLDRGKWFLEQGAMRRFAAVLRHRKAGYTSNAMVCWLVSDDCIEQAGGALASHPAVSHCYQRPIYPDWPYSLYTMLHARSDSELARLLDELSALAPSARHTVLRTLKEFKKSRVVYFA